MRLIQNMIRWLWPAEVLPPPDRSCRRFGEIADDLARHSARLGRQA